MLQTPSLVQQSTNGQGFGIYPSAANPSQIHYGGAPLSRDQAFLGQQNRSDGARTASPAGGNDNNLMQSNALAGQPFQYTSAPYSHQSVPAQAPVAFAQQQHQYQNSRQSASPQSHAATHGQPTPPQKYPMAAPPLPQTPTSQQQSATAPSPKSPQSPGSQNREQQRISLLFEINVELLQEVNRLQSEGQGGAISPQQMAQLRNEGKPDKMASDEYIQCLRRVQANLSYLMPKASTDPNSQAKAAPGPAHMTPPPHMAPLQSKYEQLRELFPGWSGMDHRPSQSSASPRPNPSNGMIAPQASAQA